MKKFEYGITRHPSDHFKEVVYFCSEGGQCSLEKVPSDEIRILNDLLNHKGQDGWELVQVAFGKDGLMAFWKREI